jgi:hypothetical protein
MADCWVPQDETCELHDPSVVEWEEDIPVPLFNCVADEYRAFDCGFDESFA